MRIRLGLLAVSALLVAIAAPAGANHTYNGTASATALRLAVTPPGAEPQALTIGFTEARVQSAPVEGGCEADAAACARAAAATEPFGTTAEARAPGEPTRAESVAFAIPEPLDQILAAQIAVAVAEAQLEPTRGQSDAAVSTIDVTLTQTLGEQVPQIPDAVEQVTEALSPVLDSDPTGQVGPRVKGVLERIAENLGSAPLATVVAGPANSTSVDADGVTTATAKSNGAVITLVPTPESVPLAPQGLIVIEVGAAFATATTDQTTATAEFDPALVRVRVFDPNEESGFREIEIAQDAERTCVGQSPLIACIGAGSGRTEMNGAAAAAEAQGVTVQLFEAPLPQVNLDLAIASAAVNAAPPPPPPPPPVVPDPDLPRTGGALALPALALGGVGLAGFAALRRRRIG
jgi:hypothetical protein